MKKILLGLFAFLSVQNVSAQTLECNGLMNPNSGK